MGCDYNIIDHLEKYENENHMAATPSRAVERRPPTATARYDQSVSQCSERKTAAEEGGSAATDGIDVCRAAQDLVPP